MKEKIIAGMFVGSVFALSVFLFSGLALIGYTAFLNSIRPGSVVVTGGTGWDRAVSCLLLGGCMSVIGSGGGLILLSIVAAVRPSLFESRIWSVVFWGCVTSALCFVSFFLLPPAASLLLIVFPAITVFTWMFVRHFRSKEIKEMPNPVSEVTARKLSEPHR